MGLSDIFVVKDDNKNETVYLVGRLVGAVVVAVVAVAVTAGSGAAAVGTSPTVVGSAVSVGSAVNAGGKVVSAVGVAGDTVSTIIANDKDSFSVNSGKVEIKNDILDSVRTGSALKVDQYHAFNDVIDNYAGMAIKTNIGNNATLYQLEGSLNGTAGRFEWIIQNCNTTHRMFVPGGTMNGVPIKP
jgi:hypothetical protein